MLEKFVAFQLFMMAPRKDDKGATATEYGLLVGLIALIIVAGVGLFGSNLNTFFSNLSSKVSGWGTN